jgi:L-ribulokinase
MVASSRYALGIDFGTESARAVLVDVTNGNEVASEVYQYKHGVIDQKLPGGPKLEHDWALQDPNDYLEALKRTPRAVMKRARVRPEEVIGVGIDFTSCTMMPIDAKGVPLCVNARWRKNPHAWVKLWKHHAAQPEADLLNATARRRNEKWLSRYGGKISSEWFFPKALQILHEAPEIYRACDRLIEGADWIVLVLTGQERRNACTAGYKAIWDKDEGFPSEDFFEALHPAFKHVVDTRMSRDIYPQGTKAGEITEGAAKLTGLLAGTAVAVGNVDAHVAVPAATITEEGKMLMIMGTSICHMVLSKRKQPVEGYCGYVNEGILPGFFGYEGGQTAVGDIYAWFVSNCVPEAYEKEARSRRLGLHELLAKKAKALRPGESGLLALDWWNGNRSILVDADLTGMLMGMTLVTKPEEVYRAIIEATAFGTYIIINQAVKAGIEVKEIYACGGLTRDPFLMQIFADVTNRPISIARSEQTCALGSAMFGAVAAGRRAGGYETIVDAARYMAGVKKEHYEPVPDNHKVYQRLFKLYEKLHDSLGRDSNSVMKQLKTLKAEAAAGIAAGPPEEVVKAKAGKPTEAGKPTKADKAARAPAPKPSAKPAAKPVAGKVPAVKQPAVKKPAVKKAAKPEKKVARPAKKAATPAKKAAKPKKLPAKKPVPKARKPAKKKAKPGKRR